MKNIFPFYYFRHIIGLLFLFLLVACQNSNEEFVPNEYDEHPIFWNVQPEALEDSRSLISDYDALVSACTQTVGGQAIGIWSALELNGSNELTQNVLGNLNGDVSLVYDDGTVWDNWEGWTYGSLAVYWKMNATYYFNAYFPKENGMTEIQQNTTSIRGKYNTITTQKDLMVCRQVVDTSADDFTTAPVPLIMKHALAALRFQFEYYSSASLYLKSFSLHNNSAEGMGLSTSGIFTYQNGDVEISNWTNNPATLGNIYAWQHPGEGFAFNMSHKAIAYMAAINTTVGEQYTQNDGNILIVPQKYQGGTTMNFTISDEDYKLDLPIRDFLPGYRYVYHIKILGDNKIDLTCTVQPWTLQEENMDFEHYVNMDAEGQLRWLSGSVVEKADNVNEVYLNAETIQCAFHIATPEGATWYASLIPVDGNDMNAFSFVDGNGNETGLSISGKVGETSALTIKRKTIKEYTRMRLQLIVKDLNGRTFMVHKEVLGSENYIWCQP